MKRVQRKRTKGWRMPPNTVYVGRGSLWGNPFTVAEHGRLGAIAKYREMLAGRGHLKLTRDLAGKNLACWCREDEPCHADVLLEFANETESQLRGSDQGKGSSRVISRGSRGP
jgi:hypothetical protein